MRRTGRYRAESFPAPTPRTPFPTTSTILPRLGLARLQVILLPPGADIGAPRRGSCNGCPMHAGDRVVHFVFIVNPPGYGLVALLENANGRRFRLLVGRHGDWRRLLAQVGACDQDVAGCQVIEARHTDEQSTLLVRSDGPLDDPRWTVDPVSLEDIVLAYMDTEVRS